jgi:hypothetical protein
MSNLATYKNEYTSQRLAFNYNKATRFAEQSTDMYMELERRMEALLTNPLNYGY